MPVAYVVILVIVVLAGAIFLADAAVGFIRLMSGTDDTAVERRLQASTALRRGGDESIELLRDQTGPSAWTRYAPFSREMSLLLAQSGIKVDLSTILLLIGALFLLALAGFLLLLPLRFVWLGVPAAAFLSFGPVLGVLFRARTNRIRKFDEQLPDAIDLIVRSLKIGHPFSGAMMVIARDMPAPIGEEFAIACEQITYGRDVSSTINDMTERVGASDLGYVAIAVQIQQESGGNLVESLSKLSAVVRDRFRMFRKVTAITAEGRFSAWMLSLFPLGIILVIQLVKPDYYTQVMDYAYFPHLVILVVVMLAINVIAMRVLTTLKV